MSANSSVIPQPSSEQLQQDLLNAVIAGDNEKIDALVEQGAIINYKDNSGNTLQHWAAANGHVDTMKHLHSAHSLDINGVDNNGNTVLHAAAANGKINAIRYLVSTHKMNVNATTTEGFTPFHLAAWNGCRDVLDYFRLTHNMDVEVRTSDNRTALYLSVQNKQTKATAHLLKKCEVNVYAENNNGDTPVKLAVRLQYTEPSPHKPKLQQALREAVCAGNNELIDRLIVRGADIRDKDNNGNTLLHWAAAYGHLETLKILQDKGLDIKVTANDGSTVLHSAAFNGHSNIISHLLTSDIDINVKTSGGHTPLHFAAWGGQVEVIKLLVQRGAEVDAIDNNGKTPSVLASESGHDAAYTCLEVALQRIVDLKAAVLRLDNPEIDRLVAEGAYIHIKDDTDSTLLHWAVSVGENAQGQVETIRHLVTQYNVDIQARDDEGNTVLHTAAAHCRKAVMVYLVSECHMDVNAGNKNLYTPLHLAAWKGHIDSVNFLVENGANVYAKAQDGRTAQVFAAEHDIVRNYLVSAVQQKWLNAIFQGSVGEIENLVAQGIEMPNCILHLAAQHNQVVIIEHLLSKGEMDINGKNDQGQTALHVATCYGKTAAVGCLLQHGATIDVLDKLKRPPLHWALMKKDLATIMALLDAGADVKIKNAAGETALHIAAFYGIEAAVTAYLEIDIANIDSKDKAGFTPLHWAAIKSHKEIIAILLKQGADPTITDKEGKTYKDLLEASASQQQVYVLGQFAVPRANGQPTELAPSQTTAPSLLLMNKRG